VVGLLSQPGQRRHPCRLDERFAPPPRIRDDDHAACPRRPIFAAANLENRLQAKSNRQALRLETVRFGLNRAWRYFVAWITTRLKEWRLGK
jgi:hypothetical protein